MLAAVPLLVRLFRSPDRVESLGADTGLVGQRGLDDGGLERVKEAPSRGGSGAGRSYLTTGGRPLWIAISTPRDGVASVIRVLPDGWELLRARCRSRSGRTRARRMAW